MSEADYAFVDAVTSDLRFVARGATLEALFGAAAEALLAATLEDPQSVVPHVQETLQLEEPALDLLLLRFLNELVYLRDARGLLLLPREISIREADGAARLEAVLVGEPIERGRHELTSDVKAATPHGLQVVRAAEGWEATVTLDV